MKIALSDEFINTARCLVPGELLVASPTDPSQSAAEGQGLEEAELGAESNFTITTRDSEARQFNKEGDQVTVKSVLQKEEPKERLMIVKTAST